MGDGVRDPSWRERVTRHRIVSRHVSLLLRVSHVSATMPSRHSAPTDLGTSVAGQRLQADLDGRLRLQLLPGDSLVPVFVLETINNTQRE